MKSFEKELENIFEALFQEGIIATYIVTDDGAEFSFNTKEESPHNVYIESENEIYLSLKEDFGEDEDGNPYEDENIIEIKLVSIDQLKDRIKKERQDYIYAPNL